MSVSFLQEKTLASAPVFDDAVEDDAPATTASFNPFAKRHENKGKSDGFPLWLMAKIGTMYVWLMMSLIRRPPWH